MFAMKENDFRSIADTSLLDESFDNLVHVLYPICIFFVSDCPALVSDDALPAVHCVATSTELLIDASSQPTENYSDAIIDITTFGLC